MSLDLDLSFEVVSKVNAACYSNACSGSRSDCCTRTCTRQSNANTNQDSSMQAWDNYLEINAGVLQY
ncbi:hypothetical protein KAM398_21190 [Acinetobacter sp. KAM398]|uniref:hypothetical protein n=1 Tax=Acinetobacter TaxID=469 RepID=UPI00057B6538|nr:MULTISPECIES: hypothetical protein [Acinetobacter]ECE6726139.1 hypothetical protein [Salmonella enterica subsp. enterica serovar Paratyphi A]ALV75029.1 hypothetical protein RZ95_19610 [Acinetobacter johnsonii XBB1]GJC32155.1 hypothetical protein KAM392_21340 [Acinetobacter sp. KAM392]GJC34982.1 hypothetical protein KAM393_21510 [Acinetobacter sp. KAM393]GJC37770.1 hypothetical protein KAM394_21100 [Acinetobacter sp. KAM394]